MSAYIDAPETIDELEEALYRYHDAMKQYRHDLAYWVGEGGDPDDENAPERPIGPVLTGAAMLEVISVVMGMRRWLNKQTEWPA